MRRMTYIAPSCPDGYTEKDLEIIMGARLPEFRKWMTGQTCSLCEGKEYNHATQQYQSTVCSGMFPGMAVSRDEVLEGHGMITYTWDVDRFLKGLPVID
jgi:hypothetical protein